MLQITDLVDSRKLVELQESEMKSIRGGECYYGSAVYYPGETVYLNNVLHICTDYPWYQGGDDWLPA